MNLAGHELARNSSRNTRPQPSQLAAPLWTDPGLKSGISVRELISTKKKKHKKKTEGGESMTHPSPKDPRKREHATTTTTL